MQSRGSPHTIAANRAAANRVTTPPAAAAATTTPPTAPAAVAAAPATASAARSRVPVRLSPRVQAGRELYAKLQEMGRLRHDHKSKTAAEVLASLHPPPAPTDPQAEAREHGLASKRSRELRDFVFSFGGLSLTRQILAMLLDMREIKLLLPDELQQRQRDADDGETAREVLRAAKPYHTQCFIVALKSQQKACIQC